MALQKRGRADDFFDMARPLDESGKESDEESAGRATSRPQHLGDLKPMRRPGQRDEEEEEDAEDAQPKLHKAAPLSLKPSGKSEKSSPFEVSPEAPRKQVVLTFDDDTESGDHTKAVRAAKEEDFDLEAAAAQASEFSPEKTDRVVGPRFVRKEPPQPEVHAPEEPELEPAALETGSRRGDHDVIRVQEDAQQEKIDRMLERLQDSPNDTDLIIRLASLLMDSERNTESLQYFRRAARLDPGNGFVRQKLHELGGAEELAALGQDVDRGEFASALADFLVYPFTGLGPAILVMGAIFFGLTTLFVAYAGPFGFSAAIIIFSYLYAYQFKAIKSSSDGSRTPPDWPDLQDAIGTVPMMFGCLLSCYGLPLFLVLMAVFSINASGPSLPATPMADFGPPPMTAFDPGSNVDPAVESYATYLQEQGVPREEAYRMAAEEFGAPPPTNQAEAAAAAPPPRPSGPGIGVIPILCFILAGLFAIAGTLYYPMALLVTALMNSSKPAFDYFFGVGSALKIFPQYALCAIAYLGATAIIGVASFALAGILGMFAVPILGPIVQSIIVSGITIYQYLALSHLIGRLYYHTADRLDWF